MKPADQHQGMLVNATNPVETRILTGDVWITVELELVQIFQMCCNGVDGIVLQPTVTEHQTRQLCSTRQVLCSCMVYGQQMISLLVFYILAVDCRQGQATELW